MNTKYGFEFSDGVVISDINRLTNQIWKLIPMRENQEDWKKQLNNVITEIVGMWEIFYTTPAFLQLLCKLEGINRKEMKFETFRRMVFDSIGIIQSIKQEVQQDE